MAEAITYAELQFGKAPPRKNASNQGQEVQKEKPAPRSCPAPPVTSQKLSCHGHFCCSKYLLLGLLLTCLLLAVAAICLGVLYQQTSQQFEELSRVLEATNSSLLEQIRHKTVQLERMEKDLQDSKKEMARRLTALQEEQKAHQPVRKQLQDCQAVKEKTQKNLQTMQQKLNHLNHLQDIVKLLLTCPSQDTCCMVGWILIQRRCFHISLTKRDWQESQKYCKSLSSDLTTFTDSHPWYYYSESSSWRSLLLQLSVDTAYWVGHSSNKDRWSYQGCSRLYHYGQYWHVESGVCSTALPCICEMTSFRFPVGDSTL